MSSVLAVHGVARVLLRRNERDHVGQRRRELDAQDVSARGTITSRAVRSLKSSTLRIISAGSLRDGAGLLALADDPLDLGLGHARVGARALGTRRPDGAADDGERIGEGHEQPLERPQGR